MLPHIFCARTQVILHAGFSIATAEPALELAATAAVLHIRAHTHANIHAVVVPLVPFDVVDVATALATDVFVAVATAVAADVFAAVDTAKTARMLPRMLCTHTRSLAEC